MISSLTVSLRFDGALNVDLSEFQKNLVHFPKVHYSYCTYAPMISSEKAHNYRSSVSKLTNYVF